MTQKNQNKYSEYINSFLNSSPSKTAYSFSKTQRFRTENYPYYQKNTQILSRSVIIKNKTNKSNIKSTHLQLQTNRTKKQDKLTKEQYAQYQKMTKKDDFQVFKVRRHLDMILKQMEKDRKLFTEISQAQKKQKIEYVYINKEARETKNKKNTRQRQQTKVNNHIPTFTQKRQERSQKQPSKNQSVQIFTRAQDEHRYPTVAGYYPVGLQMNPKGIYSSSLIKNVSSNSFGTAPPKSKSPDKKDKQRTETTQLFSSFSQFGSSRY